MTTTISSLSALNPDVALVVGGMAVLALILALVQRELAASAGRRFRPLSRTLIIVIAPLLVVFLAIVVRKLATLV